MSGHRLQQNNHAGDVLAVRVQGPAHRNSGVLEGRQMNDARDRVTTEDACEYLPVKDAALVEGHAPRDEVSMAAGEVVEDDGLDAFLHEGPHNMRADVTGAAGNQPPHARASSRWLSLAMSGYLDRWRKDRSLC